MDVAKLISQFATPTVLGQVAGALGISDSAAGKALAAAVPGVLAALLGVASKPQGAANLAASAKWLDTGAEGMLGRLGQDPGAVSGLGQNLLSSVLGGGTVGTLAEKLQSYAGLPAGTADKLLGLAGAGTLGAIGQEARDRGLDAAGIARMLEEQQPAIAGAVPADFAAALKGTGLAGLIASAARPAAAKPAPAPAPEPKPAAAPPRPAPQPAAAAPRPAPAAPPEPKRSGWTRWILILIALLVLWWLLSRMFGGEPEPVVEAPAPAPEATAPATTAEPAEPAEPEPAATPAPPADTAAAPENPLVVGGVDIGAQVTATLDTLRGTFSGITDAATAQAALPDLTAARDTLSGLETQINALPAEGKSALQSLVASALPAIEASANGLLANSAVAGVVKPVVDDIIARLKAYAA